ncbi:MAG: outer membrane lipoprotein carrier protein LolA [Bacteroidales bacterium]|nr:outer membrane lipoprotein carrier protein LolA [Bacteroidales bacterium]
MKRFLIITLLQLLIAGYGFPQNDPGALAILDRFAAKALNAPSVSMDFNLLNENQVDKTSSSVKGSIILAGNKYRLDLEDNIIWYNGETSWNLLPADKEVTITTPDKGDESFQSRPSLIFTWYKKGYKSRLLEEKTDSYLIDLYPEALDSDHVRIRLKIGKPALDLKKLEYKYKNGITVTVDVISYDLQKNPDDTSFIFEPGKHKGVEVIDMR